MMMVKMMMKMKTKTKKKKKKMMMMMMMMMMKRKKTKIELETKKSTQLAAKQASTEPAEPLGRQLTTVNTNRQAAWRGQAAAPAGRQSGGGLTAHCSAGAVCRGIAHTTGAEVLGSAPLPQHRFRVLAHCVAFFICFSSSRRTL